LWQVPWLIHAAAAAAIIYHLGAIGNHKLCKVLDLDFSSERSLPTSMLIIFQTGFPLCRTFVPLEHSTTAQSFFAVLSLEHLKNIATRFS
jgi:hypothetical protein